MNTPSRNIVRTVRSFNPYLHQIDEFLTTTNSMSTVGIWVCWYSVLTVMTSCSRKINYTRGDTRLDYIPTTQQVSVNNAGFMQPKCCNINLTTNSAYDQISSRHRGKKNAQKLFVVGDWRSRAELQEQTAQRHTVNSPPVHSSTARNDFALQVI